MKNLIAGHISVKENKMNFKKLNGINSVRDFEKYIDNTSAKIFRKDLTINNLKLFSDWLFTLPKDIYKSIFSEIMLKKGFSDVINDKYDSKNNEYKKILEGFFRLF